MVPSHSGRRYLSEVYLKCMLMSISSVLIAVVLSVQHSIVAMDTGVNGGPSPSEFI